ncbi:MAG: hypothetical protein LBD55_08295 [Treponema sp.]|nr:hypothetical protein [Treponema sp.]
MENILQAARPIAGKLHGADHRSRRTLTAVLARDGKPWVRGGWWRTYLFIEGTHRSRRGFIPEEARFLS